MQNARFKGTKSSSDPSFVLVMTPPLCYRAVKMTQLGWINRARAHQAVNSLASITAAVVVAVVKVDNVTAVEIGSVTVAFGTVRGFKTTSVALKISSVWLLIPFVSSMLSNSRSLDGSTVGKVLHFDLMSMIDAQQCSTSKVVNYG